MVIFIIYMFRLKELVFKNKKGLDVFIVNSHGSLFQLLWWPVMIPITLIFNQTKGVPLWDYVRDGFRYENFTDRIQLAICECA
jgi:hypothetical protein